MSEEECRMAVARLVLGILIGEVQARMLIYALGQCGIGWNAESGRFETLR